MPVFAQRICEKCCANFNVKGDTVSENTSPAAPAGSLNNWEQLFKAALLERHPALLEQRLQDAKDAIMDRIEDCFDTATLSERRLLVAAMNSISERQRVSKVDDLRLPLPAQTFHHAA